MELVLYYSTGDARMKKQEMKNSMPRECVC